MKKPHFEFETDMLMTSRNAQLQLRKPDAPREKRGRGSRRYARLNRRIAFFVGASVALSPIPIALNRPSLWLIWVGLTAITTVIYMALGNRAAPSRPLLTLRFFRFFAIALAIPAFAIIQSVPIGSFVPLDLGWPVGSFPDQMHSVSTISLLPSASVVGALRFTGYVVFAALVIEVSGRADRASTLGWVIFWATVTHAVWGVAALRFLGDAALFGEKRAYLGAATGTFINRNSFATFLSMGGVFGLALILDRSGRARMRRARPIGFLGFEYIEAITLWLALAIIYLALILTQSRLGIAASAVGTVFCFASMRIKLGAKVWTTCCISFGLGLFVLIGALTTLGQGVLERTVFLASAFEARLNGYRLSMDLIAARPWFGYGLDTFRPAFELVHADPMDPQIVWDRAHSTYLTHWIELGLLIGSLPIVLGFFVFWRLIDILKRRSVDFALSVGALSAFIVAASHSVNDFSLELPANVIMLITILGLGITHRANPRNIQVITPVKNNATPKFRRKQHERIHGLGKD